jgi:hypothetical protein
VRGELDGNRKGWNRIRGIYLMGNPLDSRLRGNDKIEALLAVYENFQTYRYLHQGRACLSRLISKGALEILAILIAHALNSAVSVTGS